MNKKGFTLIELLAVIVILAIIALITTPIVLNLINQSKEAANKRSVEAYAKAVEYAVAEYEYNHNGELPTDFDTIKDNVEYSNSDVHCIVQINGNSMGSVELCGCQVGSYTNTYYKYSSKQGNKGALEDTNKTDEREMSTKGSCKETPIVYTDTNNDEKISKGDMIKIGNDEFYVISLPENGEVKMIAKYNLDANSRQSSSNSIDVTYASSNYWGSSTNFTDESSSTGYPKTYYIYRNSDGSETNNNIKIYINNYKDYLVNDLGVEEIIDVRIISLLEAVRAGCSSRSNSCPVFMHDDLWIGSGTVGSDYLYIINQSSIGGRKYNTLHYIRPLVIISEDAIN